jgi:hypothetical protein
MSEDRDEYLAALEEARAEREALHPHQPVLPPERHLHSVPSDDDTPPRALDETTTTSSTTFELEQHYIETGRRRIAEMRQLIAQHRRPGA